jgi:hypothetical protein
MTIQRHWATPLTIGAFLLMAVTGVLMFFHLDRGLNKEAHEWLGWAMIVAVGLHVAVNFAGFKRHLVQPTGRVLIGVFVVLLGLSFVTVGNQSDEPGFAPPLRAMAQVPLSTLAPVLKLTTAELRERLGASGVLATSDTQTLAELVGPDLRRQIGALNGLLAAPKP